jgi:K+-sensing histidine kinase KdpD
LRLFNATNYNKTAQYTISIALVLLTAISCYLGDSFIGYKAVALLLLMVVSVLAMLFDILPVLVAAVLSAFYLAYQQYRGFVDVSLVFFYCFSQCCFEIQDSQRGKESKR